MNNRNIYDILQERYKMLQKKYEVVGIFLIGSQNYDLHYEDSDIDTKAIILPTFEDIVLNKKPISTTLILENDEHIDLKDIRLMFDCFKKQNINFIEILFTEYKIINPKYEKEVFKLLSHNEKIARYNIFKAINCIYGMSMEKRKALTHPYPSIKHKIDKFKYDPKQLHHIIRLNNFYDSYIEGCEYSRCLKSIYKEYMIKVKKGETHTLEQAISDADKITRELKEKVNNYMKNNKPYVDLEVEKILNNILVDIFKNNLKDV